MSDDALKSGSEFQRSLQLAVQGAVAAACVATLAGCEAVGPDYARPAAIVPPAYKEFKGFKPAEPQDDAAKGAWWRAFGDPDLDLLEPKVAVSNQTLKADEAAYREALALIDQARAGLYPSATANATATRKEPGFNNLNALVDATWTIDVWGKVRRAVEREGAAAEVAEADLANATLAAQAALAIAFVQLRQADAQHDLYARTVTEYQRSLDIAQNQYDAGTVAKSDVVSARTQLLSAQAQLVGTGVARAQNEHAIAVLVGEPPANLFVPHGAAPPRVPAVPPSVPSRLLERRPDIAAAERAMAQANAAVGVAVGGYYPDIGLTGAAGYIGDPFVRQVSGANPAWTFGFTLAQTLLNGGLTAAQVEAAKDAYDAAVATYRQTVLTAFQQVEDGLSSTRVLAEQVKVSEEAVKSARQSVDIALNEYRAGTLTYTAVVQAQATALANEQSYVQTRAQQLEAAVNLVVALGGGWSASALRDPLKTPQP